MSHDTYELKAEAREQVGKGSARAVRRNGKVPAVIYGDKQPPLAIALNYKDVFYKIHGGGFLTTIATIDVDGKKIQVLPKDFQLDPVKDFPVHVDFLRIGKDTEVNVDVPVHFINEDKSDFHWYRQEPTTGRWSQKNGPEHPNNCYSNGTAFIVLPEMLNDMVERPNLRPFQRYELAAYFYVPSGGIHIEGAP